jgi:membrane protease YdiL (CAAX protease family)
MLRWQTVAVAYALLGSLAFAFAAAAHQGTPFVHPSPWFSFDPTLQLAASALAGVVLTVLLVTSTRFAVRRWDWAQKLHSDLRPVARNLTASSIVLVAVLSGLGEELFFRGFLVPTIGVVAQAAIFGLAHQVRGPSRWVWVGWASLVGLCFGVVFALTGSLVGPILAHVLVNGYNLAFLRDHDPAPKRRLGGIFASSDIS